MPADREHPRFAHEAAVTFHVGRKAYQGRTHNVSRGGLSANLADPIAHGSAVEVDIQLVFDEGTTSEALRLPARVAWCTTLDEGYQIGLSFHGLDPERLEYLTLFLKYLDDGAAPDRPFQKSPDVDDRFG